MPTTFAGFSARCVAGMTVVFAVGAAPAVYGFVVYALGATIEQFIFFALVSLVGYRFLRPGKDELERLWEQTVAGPAA
jgi:membrane protein implicated in regulation of membrane protease activity